MKEPFRLRVLKALAAALEEIGPASGYQFDLAGRVFRGRDMFGDNDPVPMLCILECVEQTTPLESRQPPSSGLIASSWDLQVQGFVDDDFDNPTDPGHWLMAEVKRRLAAERVRDRQYNILGMGGRVTELKFSPGIVRPADELSGKAYFWLRVTVTVVENLLDPYA